MPPRKRASSKDEDDVQNPPTMTTTKRRRISLACNPCRAAREKCDGERPHCGACTLQHRSCSYTVSSKKRGVQTGYLRTIELALAWVLDEVPESESALQRLLTDNGGREGAKLLTKKTGNGHHLHNKWNRSRVHKEIARLLADGETLPKDASESGEDEGETPTTASIRSGTVENDPDIHIQRNSQHMITTSAPLKLPRQWRRLVDIYHSYTYCWLPIIDKQSLFETASLYPPEGLQRRRGSTRQLPSRHAELWAVFALASLQDRNTRTGHEGDADSSSIYSVSQMLLPGREETLDWPEVRAMLLHSLILLGQGKFFAAWSLAGSATRASLCLQASLEEDERSTMRIQPAVTVNACFVLDVWLSLTLGQQPQMHTQPRETWSLEHVLASLSTVEEESWKLVPGFAASSQDTLPTDQTVSRPFQTLHQLFKFSETIGAHLTASSHNCSGAHKVSPEDFAKSLDPRFGYCNSLMGTTPAIPSAFVLQASFLAGTVALSSACRPSLLSTFAEVVENCLQSLGAPGTPPILHLLMGFMQYQAKTNTLDTSMHILGRIWALDAARGADQRSPTTVQGNEFDREQFEARRFSETTVVGGIGHRTELGKTASPLPANYLSPQDNFRTPAPNLDAFLSMQTGSVSYESSRTEGIYPIPTPQSGYGQSQMMDYDAILDQLGSIDCTDSIDLDPQFMANLGFAPGCGFGEPGFDEA